MKRSNYKKKSEVTKKKPVGVTITIHDEFELCPSHIALLLFFKIFFFILFYVYDFKTSLHDLSNIDFPTQIIIVFTDSN